MQRIIKQGSKELIIFLLFLAAFIPLGRVNYVLFHTAIEFIAIFVSFGIFVFYYNTRNYDVDGIYQILGVSYLFVGITDFFHTMAYKGMNVIPYTGENEAIGLWIFARSIEVMALLIAPFFYQKSVHFSKLFARTTVLFAVFSILYIRYHQNFPIFFIEGQGLTLVKVLIEYGFCLLLLIPLWKISKLKGQIDNHSRVFLMLAIVFTILSELSFTLYIDLYGVMNATGHMLKVLSFYYIYKAMIDVTIQDPLSTLFVKLSQEKSISLAELESTKLIAKRNFKELFDYKRVLDQGFIVFMTNTDGVITQVNRNFCLVSGLAENQILSFSIEQVVATETKINLALKTGHHYILKNKADSGRVFWISGMMTPFFNEHYRLINFLFVGHDITRHKMQEELLIKNQKMSAIGEVTSQILHDMMNPLTIISYSNDQLKEYFQQYSDPQVKKKYLEKIALIDESYERMTAFFHGFRKQLQNDLSQDHEYHMKTVALRDLAEKAIKFCDYRAQQSNIIISSDIDPKITTECFDHQLTQVLVNLLTNSIDAIKYLEQRWIKLSYEERPLHHVLKVTDSGTGIPAEYQSEIFKNLFTTKKDDGGTGLGMGICRAIVEAHQGQLVLNTNSEHTEFLVILPKKGE